MSVKQGVVFIMIVLSLTACGIKRDLKLPKDETAAKQQSDSPSQNSPSSDPQPVE